MTLHKKHGIKLRSVYQWHRYIGASIAIFLIVIAVTGIMLNHTVLLEFDKKYIHSDWLLDYYGISAPDKIISYQAGNFWVSQWHTQLYLGDYAVTQTDKNIIGAVYYHDMIVFAQNDTVFVYTADGNLIDKITGYEGVPSGIQAIGITDKNQLAVRAANGVFTTNKELLFWQNTPLAITIWSDPDSLPQLLYHSTLERYRGKGLTLERIILDLHSGRLLGDWGIYFTDLIALMMIFLTSSGLWLWMMRIIKKRQHQH